MDVACGTALIPASTRTRDRPALQINDRVAAALAGKRGPAAAYKSATGTYSASNAHSASKHVMPASDRIRDPCGCAGAGNADVERTPHRAPAHSPSALQSRHDRRGSENRRRGCTKAQTTLSAAAQTPARGQRPATPHASRRWQERRNHVRRSKRARCAARATRRPGR